MGWIIAIIVGGVIGWIASMIMGRDASMGIFWNIIVGLIGAVLGGWLGTTLLGVDSTLTAFSLPGLLMSLLGAVVLLAIMNLIQRGPRPLSRYHRRGDASASVTLYYEGAVSEAGRAFARPATSRRSSRMAISQSPALRCPA